MFGKRSGGSISRPLRLIIGAIASLVGAGLLWQAFNISAGRVEDATAPPALVFLFAFAMLGLGLTVLIGALAGVGDRGERPASMGLPMRLMLDGLGYMWGVGFVGFAAYMALSPEMGAGTAATIGRIVFGFFALLFGGFVVLALFEALRRALRGLPYLDGPPPDAEP